VPLDLPSGFQFGECIDVSPEGRIVGVAWDDQFTSFEGWYRDGLGAPVAIGNYPGHFASQLSCINSSHVAGGASVDDSGIQFGLTWTAGVIDVYPPPVGWDSATFLDINRSGQIVGVLQDSASGGIGAAILQGSTVIELQQLLDPISGAGWLLLVAQESNLSGQIACTGITPLGTIGACVLTPSSQPLVGAPAQPSERARSVFHDERAMAAVRRSLERLPAMNTSVAKFHRARTTR
jgi:hypothetical protein